MGVGTVDTGGVILVGGDAEVAERGVELGVGAFDGAGLVGVLDADEVAAAELAGKVLVEHGDLDATEVSEAGRAWAEPGHQRTLWEVPRRVPLLPVLRTGQVRREQGVDLVTVEHFWGLHGN